MFTSWHWKLGLQIHISMPRNSPNCSNKHRQCCTAGLVTARCSPIGLKTGGSNTARWISAAVHNSKPGVCLRKAPHSGSNRVEEKKKNPKNKNSDGQQAIPDVLYWLEGEATRPIFTDKRLHTGRSNHRWASRNTSSDSHFAVFATDKKRLSEVVLANAFSVFQHSTLLHPPSLLTAQHAKRRDCVAAVNKGCWPRSARRNTSCCSLDELD